MLRTLLCFHTTIPSDMVEDDEDIVTFGGRNLVVAIGKMLEKRGYRVSEPIYAGDHGWEANVFIDDARLWFQVTELGDPERYLIAEHMRQGYSFDRYKDYLRGLDADLRRDPRFYRFLWFDRDKPLRTPSVYPVDP
jgi:hypothetical protein